jgi:hypothetical protein
MREIERVVWGKKGATLDKRELFCLLKAISAQKGLVVVVEIYHTHGKLLS